MHVFILRHNTAETVEPFKHNELNSCNQTINDYMIGQFRNYPASRLYGHVTDDMSSEVGASW
jgi:hypothetical protein